MNKTLHRFAMTLAGATLFLIFVGGLVKTTDSGLAVPDWPLSYGRLMPPMVGGILYEHGHRMVAATVGFLTVLFALAAVWIEKRRWVRRAAWAAVGLVILQGVLGGITVLLRLPKPVSIAHACTAQTFFCLVVALAVWTSRFWQTPPTLRVEPVNTVPLHRALLALFAVGWLQLLLGATVRHTGWAFPFHVGGAAALLALTSWVVARAWRDHRDMPFIPALATLAGCVLVVQICLGIGTFLLLRYNFSVMPPPFWAIATITLHVAVGALFLGTVVILALVTYRTRPAHSAPLQTTLSDYLTLTKPGISFMAGITALAGFVLGSHGDVNLPRLFHTCVGTLLCAGGAGCLNMLIERDTDARMTRTQSRPLPSGRLNPGEVLLLGTLFSGAGVIYLCSAVNLLTAIVAALTVSIYLYVYTPLKKISVVCVTVGAVAGALPPVIGWTAATGRLGIEPLALFGIIFFWQYPHFLSLAWLYKDDYAKGGLHMVGTRDAVTGRVVLATSVALFLVSCLPSALGLTGHGYLAVATALGVIMTAYSYKFFRQHARAEARRIFLFSLLYIPVLVAMMVLNSAGHLWAS